jgi:hypothetical protein
MLLTRAKISINFSNQGYETETRRAADLEDFEQSFLANWDAKKYPRGRPVVEMIPDDKSKSYASWFQNNQGPEEKYRINHSYISLWQMLTQN